ncbi:MAG: hypothetical protein K2M48_04880 [Clostridiales bacterium]|nr:hypothetical protein [Clostridiales bacterium]
MKAPNNCPICNSREEWRLIDSTKKGFSGGKAVVAGALFGMVGLAAGFMGKKKSLYQCVACGFSHEYDGVADKDLHTETVLSDKNNGYKNKGLNAVYIDIVRKATPICPFCNKPQNLYVAQDGSSYKFLCGTCHAEYRCSFTFGNKVKSESTQILDCGEENINNYEVGVCDAKLLIRDETKIK